MIDPLIIPIVAITGVFASITVGTIAHYAYLGLRIKAETSLKQEMVLRGYSAEQIAQVLSARPSQASASACWTFEKPHKKAA